MFVDQVTFVAADGVLYTDDVCHDVGALRAEPRGGMVVISRMVGREVEGVWQQDWVQLRIIAGNKYESFYEALVEERLAEHLGVPQEAPFGVPEQILNDPQKRREWIQHNMPIGLVPGEDREEKIDFFNAQMEWMYQVATQIDEMPDWRTNLHFRRLMRAAKALARDAGVEITDPPHAGILIYTFLMREGDDPGGEPDQPEPEPTPAEEVST